MSRFALRRQYDKDRIPFDVVDSQVANLRCPGAVSDGEHKHRVLSRAVLFRSAEERFELRFVYVRNPGADVASMTDCGDGLRERNNVLNDLHSCHVSYVSR
jgi:hypothetical protein